MGQICIITACLNGLNMKTYLIIFFIHYPTLKLIIYKTNTNTAKEFGSTIQHYVTHK